MATKKRGHGKPNLKRTRKKAAAKQPVPEPVSVEPTLAEKCIMATVRYHGHAQTLLERMSPTIELFDLERRKLMANAVMQGQPLNVLAVLDEYFGNIEVAVLSGIDYLHTQVSLEEERQEAMELEDVDATSDGVKVLRAVIALLKDAGFEVDALDDVENRYDEKTRDLQPIVVGYSVLVRW